MNAKRRIRERAASFLSPEVAASASMSLAELMGFVNGSYHPSEGQLLKLARRLHLEKELYYE